MLPLPLLLVVLLLMLLMLLQVVKTWMSKMNLTMAELKERPGLVAAVVAYHGAQ
jgi:hypothetical protein